MLGYTVTIALAFLLSTSVSAAEPANSETVYYQAEFKTSSLGNYKMSINSFETPSHEVLPIISKDYFSNTLKEFTTEVDNTEPSARYDTKSVSKVDVVFAIGDTKQSEQLQNFIPTFTTQLESAGNFIDARVEQVKTSTIDMSAFGAREIFENWRKMPQKDGFGTTVWKLDEREGKIYTEGIKKASAGAHRSAGIIDESAAAFETTDFKMEFTYSAKGPKGEEVYRNVNNGWSNHDAGALFRYQEDEDGVWTAYAVLIGDCAPGWSHGVTGKGFVALLKVRNGSADFLPGRYYSTLFVAWSAGVADTSGALTTITDNPGSGRNYPLYKWVSGEGGTAECMSLGARAITNTESKDFKIECKGNNIKVYCGDKLQLDVTDSYGSPYSSGAYGFYSLSSPNIYFSNVKITKGEKKSLGDAISNVQWRDGSARVIIHAAETVPDDMKDEQSNDYAYTLSKVLNTNAYLINLGTSINEKQLTDFGKKLTTANGETKAVYYNSRSPDIVSAMIKSKDYIVELCRTLSKSVSWVLVNEEVIWNTTYNDTEKDLPLNYGGNKDDINISNTWGMALTNYYKEDKLFAEKWRYRHTLHFDNSTIIEPWSDTWIEDPVRIFENPGKFRINYKRRDNPLYTNTSLSSPFDSYRYFSKDYDRREILE